MPSPFPKPKSPGHRHLCQRKRPPLKKGRTRTGPSPVPINPVVKRAPNEARDKHVIENQPVPDVLVAASPATTANPEPEIRQLIEAWADAWSRHGIQEFLRFYSDNFVPANPFTLQEWKDAYTLVFDTSKSMKVSLVDVVVEVESPNRAKATVILNFEDNGSQNEKHKQLLMKRESKGWRIVEEMSNMIVGSDQSRVIPNNKTVAIRQDHPVDPLDDAPSPEATVLPIAMPVVIEETSLKEPSISFPKIGKPIPSPTTRVQTHQSYG